MVPKLRAQEFPGHTCAHMPRSVWEGWPDCLVLIEHLPLIWLPWNSRIYLPGSSVRICTCCQCQWCWGEERSRSVRGEQSYALLSPALLGLWCQLHHGAKATIRLSPYFLAAKRMRQMFRKFQNCVIRSESLWCSGERMYNFWKTERDSCLALSKKCPSYHYHSRRSNCT